MKKTACILLVAFLSVFGQSQSKPEYKVGLLVDAITQNTNAILNTLKLEVKNAIGEDANVAFPENFLLTNQYDSQKALENYNLLVQSDVDIVISAGMINASILSTFNSFSKPTILFGAFSNELNDFNETLPENLYLIISSQSYEKDLITFRDLTDFNSVSIVVEEQALSSLPIKRIFDDITKRLSVSYQFIPFSDVNDILRQLENSNAIYFAGGTNLTPSDIDTLVAELIKKRIPSFTTTSYKDVESGLMGTYMSNESISQLLRRTAITIETIIKGDQDYLSKKEYYLQQTDLTLNYTTMESVGIPIKYSLLATTNFVGSINRTSADKTYNLLDAMQEVVDANLSLQSRKKDVELSKQDTKMAVAEYFPDISASAIGVYIDPDLAEISNGENPEYKTSGVVSLTQVLFSETVNANISIQKSVYKATEEDYNTEQLDAIYDISNLYFNALILKANVQIQKQNLELTNKNLKIANQNFISGQSNKTDVLRFKSESAQNTQSFIESINSLEQSLIGFNQLLNKPPDYKIDIEEVDLNKGLFKDYDYTGLKNIIDNPKMRVPFVEYLIEVAIENAPELKSIAHNLDAIERTIKLYGTGRFLPTLSLQGEYNRDFNQWGRGSAPEPLVDSNYNVVLNLSVPIFQKNQNNINRQSSEIQREQLHINQDNLRLAISNNITNSVINLSNEIANIETSRVFETAAKENLELSQASYKEGAITLITLLDAQNNYLEAQLSRVNSVYNYHISALQLERYLGYYFLLNTSEENQKFIQGFYNYLQNSN